MKCKTHGDIDPRSILSLRFFIFNGSKIETIERKYCCKCPHGTNANSFF
jgi:hypothetical protein